VARPDFSEAGLRNELVAEIVLQLLEVPLLRGVTRAELSVLFVKENET
jgi:hypothetical protein